MYYSQQSQQGGSSSGGHGSWDSHHNKPKPRGYAHRLRALDDPLGSSSGGSDHHGSSGFDGHSRDHGSGNINSNSSNFGGGGQSGATGRSLFAAYGTNGRSVDPSNFRLDNHGSGGGTTMNGGGSNHQKSGGMDSNTELQPLRVPALGGRGGMLAGTVSATNNTTTSLASPRNYVGGGSLGLIRDAVGVGRRHRGGRQHGNHRGRRQKNSSDQLLGVGGGPNHGVGPVHGGGSNNMHSIETSSMFQSINNSRDAGASSLGSSMTSGNGELPLLPQLSASGGGSGLSHGSGSTNQHHQQQQPSSMRRVPPNQQHQQQQHAHQQQQQQQQQQQHLAHPVNNVSTVPRESLPMYTEEHQFASVTSIKGLKPGNPNWINQDNFFIIEKFDNRDINFYCVFDGHGENGHHVSRRCREAFPQHIRSSNLDMKRAFNIMQNDLNSCEFDVRCSGATCVLASLCGGRLSVSNCGDSRAVLGRRNPNGSVTAHALTQDHKPDKPEERKRILACGGHLGCRQVLVNQAGRGPISMPVGPCRVWYQNRGETLGLAMSRSLGDTIVHRSGVSAEPETLEHIVDEFDEFMIIATDGVWDVIDNNQAVQMVQNFVSKSSNWSQLDASNTVTKFARSRWEKLSPMVDDITAIVVKLNRRT